LSPPTILANKVVADSSCDNTPLLAPSYWPDLQGYLRTHTTFPCDLHVFNHLPVLYIFYFLNSKAASYAFWD